MTEEEEKDIKKAQDNLYDAIFLDETRFEQKITYLSAGSIALSLTFVATLKSEPYVMWALVHGLILSVFSLTMNMYLYIWGKDRMRDLIASLQKDIDNGVYPDPDPNTQIVSLSKRIDRRNKINLCALIAGMIYLVVFVCLNI